MIRAQAVAQLAALRRAPALRCRAGAHLNDPSCHAPLGTPESRHPQPPQPQPPVDELVAVPFEVWAAATPG